MMMRAVLAERLRALGERGRYRVRRLLESPQGARVVVDGQSVVNFCSNDYLGLAGDSRIAAAMGRALEDYGAGSGASHLVCGHGRLHRRLEARLADYTGRERALLFSTGYMANLGVIAALAGQGDAVFLDRLNHASLLDGAVLSGARFRRYAHADAEDLRRLLAESSARQKLVVTDAVFSMDGDVAALSALAAVAVESDAWLMVDDAHGFGVLGPKGRGTIAQYGLSASEVPVMVGTLGKACGLFGAFVAGDRELIEWLVQRARSYIYSTALPPAVAGGLLEALRLVQEEGWRRERLHGLIARFRAGAAASKLPLLDSTTPIQPLLVGDDRRAMALSRALLARGYWVAAIRPPTVPEGTARLRITLGAAHAEAEVDGLLELLAELWTEGAVC